MKTRENELHEPKIERGTTRRLYDEYAEIYFGVRVFCPLCRNLLCGRSEPDTSKSKRDFIEKRVLKEIPNFCPNCGARLKEIEE